MGGTGRRGFRTRLHGVRMFSVWVVDFVVVGRGAVVDAADRLAPVARRLVRVRLRPSIALQSMPERWWDWGREDERWAIGCGLLVGGIATVGIADIAGGRVLVMGVLGSARVDNSIWSPPCFFWSGKDGMEGVERS